MSQTTQEAAGLTSPFATQTEAAARLLANAILSGELKSGTRLNIREISAQTGIGPTPTREALSNLAGRGLVTFSGQRGFRVVESSREDLAAILTARDVVERGALVLAIRNGQEDWEAGLVAALHRLKIFTSNPPTDMDVRIETFERVHRSFHLALIGACGSKRLLSIYSDLYDQTRRYRAMTLHGGVDRHDAFERHEALVDRCLARDEEGALEVLTEHNSFLLEVIYDRPSGFVET